MVSRAQAHTGGLSARQIEWRLKTGRWRTVHKGVYASFTGTLSFQASVWAAILHVGTGAAASHQTAAYLDGLCDEPGPLVHVTVPAPRRIRHPIDAVQVHYAHRLERTRHPAKAPPRTRLEETVLDLADVARGARDVETWVIRACERRLTTPDRLATALGLRKKIRWRAVLESMLSAVADGAESLLELQHLRRVERAHGLPRGKRQRRAIVARRVVWIDVDYDDFDLRVELDGRVGHVEEGRFRDRWRDNRATVAGQATLRYGHTDLFADPCGVAAEQARVLAARGWTGTLRLCGPNCTATSGRSLP